MNKKIIMFIMVFLLIGCSSEITFQDFANEITEGYPNEIKGVDVLTFIEYEDAKIGLSLAEEETGGLILYINALLIDREEGIVTESHGSHTPLYLYTNNGCEEWLDAKDDDVVLAESQDNTTKHKYIFGVIKGDVSSVEYLDRRIDMEEIILPCGNKSEITLWVLQLGIKENFDSENLIYQ